MFDSNDDNGTTKWIVEARVIYTSVESSLYIGSNSCLRSIHLSFLSRRFPKSKWIMQVIWTWVFIALQSELLTFFLDSFEVVPSRWISNRKPTSQVH